METLSTWPDLSAPVRAAYWQALREVGRALDVHATSVDALQACRAASPEAQDVGAYGRVMDASLAAAHGAVDDTLRRGALAASALDLNRRSTGLPAELRLCQTQAHERLAERLASRAALTPGVHARAAAFVLGVAIPAGAMTLFVPARGRSGSAALRSRRLAGQIARLGAQADVAAALAWIAEVGARPWIALHLDPDRLDAFDAQGLALSFQAAALVLRRRTDLAGLEVASWFCDPQVGVISPRLAFLRDIAADGGALFLRLPTSEEQVGYALARSPTRRQAHAEGRYQPTCYGLYWPRAALLAWAGRRSSLPQAA